MKIKSLSSNEVKRLLSIIDNLEDKCLITLGLDLGCRVSEIVNIQSSNINFDEQTIKLWDEKKDEWRIVVFTSPTTQLIKMYLKLKKKNTKLLFNFSCKTVGRRLKKWCKKVGISKELSHWHTLRHTFVVLSQLKERSIKFIQMQTGNSVGTILKYYSNLSPEQCKMIAETKPILPSENGA